MATTTATITINSSDLTGDPLALSTTATLYKAGQTVGLEKLHGGQFAYMPTTGDFTLKLFTSTSGTVVEYMVIGTNA